jgi:hypothetical protein
MITVGELKEALRKYPDNVRVVTYGMNAHLRGDSQWSSHQIQGIEVCQDGSVALVHGPS